MQIYVCVKHVPDTAVSIKLTSDTTYNDTACNFIINPYDEYALEAAVQWVEKEGRGEIVAVTVGPEDAETTIRSALAMGAHRGILVRHDQQFLDSITTAMALKAVIMTDAMPDHMPDLILGGKSAVDTEGTQTLYHLAAALEYPIVNEIVKLGIDDGRAVVEKEVGGGTRQIIEMGLPAVLGATKGLNEPRYPKFAAIMKAKKKKIKTIDLADLDFEAVAEGPVLVKLDAVPERTAAQILEGGMDDQVNELIDILKDKEKVL